MRHPKFTVRLGLVLLGLVSTITAAASSAVAAESELSIRDAGVQARGAGLVVNVVAACPAGASATAVVQATQAQADHPVANGTGFRHFLCTGAAQVVRVGAVPEDLSRDGSLYGGPPFRSGVALVTARLDYCVEQCVSVQSARTVPTPALGMNARRSIRPEVALTLPSSASLEADGAGVVIRVPYRCTAALTLFTQVRLLQRTSADRVSSADALMRAPCTGTGGSGVVNVHARSAAFATGVAFVVITGSVCGLEDCVDGVQAHRTISLT